MQNFLECLGILGLILIAAITLCVIVTIIELLVKLHFRKCPYCGKRMVYDHLHEGKSIDDSYYEFRCDHCGAYDKVDLKTIHN